MQPDPGKSDHVRFALSAADNGARESLCGLLCIGDRLEVVGSTGEIARALDLVVETRPDVVLLDPRLPDLDEAPTFIEKVRAAVPGVHVLQEGLPAGGRRADRVDLAGAALPTELC